MLELEKLSSTAQRVFAQIQKHPNESRWQIANALHLNETQIRDALNELLAAGLIEKSGPLAEMDG